MQFKHFFTMVTFLVGAVFVTTDIGFDVALFRNYVYQEQVRVDEVCDNKFRVGTSLEEGSYTAYFECVKKHGNYPPEIFPRKSDRARMVLVDRCPIA